MDDREVAGWEWGSSSLLTDFTYLPGQEHWRAAAAVEAPQPLPDQSQQRSVLCSFNASVFIVKATF